MDCYLCSNEALSVRAKGLCAVCNQAACSNPSKRHDRVFHGDTCVCGCGKFVCEADIDEHARRKHSGSAPTCFPKIAAVGSTRMLNLAASVIVSGLPVPDPGTVRHLNEFLNHISPGSQTLRDERASVAWTLTIDGPEYGRSDRPSVYFTSEFFTRAVMKRLSGLAAETLGKTCLRLEMGPIFDAMQQGDANSLEWILERYAYDGGGLFPTLHTTEAETKALAEVFDRWLPNKDQLRFLRDVPIRQQHEKVLSWLEEDEAETQFFHV